MLKNIHKIRNYFNKKGIMLIEISPVDRGACNDVYFLKNEKSENFILKLKKETPADKEINSLKKEFLILKALAYKKINFLPKITKFISGLDGYLYEYIEGEDLNRTWTCLHVTDRKKVIDSIVKFQYSIHKTSNLEGVKIKNGHKNIRNYINFVKRKIEKESGSENDLHLSLLKIENIVLDLKYSPVVKIIHNDIHPGNLLIYNNKISGIVDFGKTVCDDIHKDFSHLISAYPQYTNQIISTYKKISGITLSKEVVILYSIIRDVEKASYHLKKITDKQKNIDSKLKKFIHKY